VRLTNGPLSYTNPVVSRDGKRVFALGSKARAELVRYDEQIRQLVPFLSGISATDPTFSRDGKWVAYRSYPDCALWRSRTDGSERQQLTYLPTVIWYPFLSPDGREVAFATPKGIFVQSVAGGEPRRIAGEDCVVGAWSPNGKRFALNCYGPPKEDGYTVELRVADLENGTTSLIPGSEGKIGPFWADQNTLIAATRDAVRFLTFDLTARKWSPLASGEFVNWFISPDGKYLNCTTGGGDPTALRIRIADGKTETVTSLKGLRRVMDPRYGTQVNVAPDGSLLFTRDIGTQEIYALDVKWP
jgi:hypothetical protein